MIAENSKALLFCKAPNSNPFLGVVGKLLLMETKLSARRIVAKNLRRLMEGHPTLNTQQKVGEKAGVKQRTVGYLLDPETADMQSPKLETVERVARAFGIEAWVLLADPLTFGEELTRFLQRPPATNARLAELGTTPLTETPPAVGGKRRGKKRSLV